MDDDPQTVLIILISLLFSAFFSGMEIAFVSSNKLKIELDHRQGFLSGKILHHFVKRTPMFMASLLLANNIGLVVYGIFFAQFIESFLVGIWKEPVFVIGAQMLIATMLVLVTGEFLPKTFFRINPNHKLRVAAIPLFFFYVILFVPTAIMLGISMLFLKLFGVDTSSSQRAFNRVDLDHYVRDISEQMEGKPDLEMDNEIRILHNALEFSKVEARDCLVPRPDIVAVDIVSGLAALRQRFIDTGYSKILVYRDTIDNIIGYIHAFELFRRPKSISEIMLPVAVVPEGMLVKDLLPRFMQQKRSVAVVVDEFGGTAGIVTVEDIIEEIFGEIRDEHDTEELVERQLSANTWLFSGRIKIEHLNARYNLDIPQNGAYETFAGFVIHYLEEIPQQGKVFKSGRFQITVMDVSDARVNLLRVEKSSD
jgi:putative hemolysin